MWLCSSPEVWVPLPQLWLQQNFPIRTWGYHSWYSISCTLTSNKTSHYLPIKRRSWLKHILVLRVYRAHFNPLWVSSLCLVGMPMLCLPIYLAHCWFWLTLLPFSCLVMYWRPLSSVYPFIPGSLVWLICYDFMLQVVL